MLWDICLINMSCFSHRLGSGGCTIKLFPGMGNLLQGLGIPSLPHSVSPHVLYMEPAYFIARNRK